MWVFWVGIEGVIFLEGESGWLYLGSCVIYDYKVIDVRIVLGVLYVE